MKEEFKKEINQKILSLVNRYLKNGSVVQPSWPFFARGEIEKLMQEVYEHGYKNGFDMGAFEKAIDKLI